MNMETKKFKVDIFGDQYLLISDESEEKLAQAAKLVDLLMREIAEKSKISDTKKVAVLAALRIANNFVNLESIVQKYSIEQKRLADLIDKKALSSSSTP